jgi:uncharacterized protein
MRNSTPSRLWCSLVLLGALALGPAVVQAQVPDRKDVQELVQLVTPRETYQGVVEQMTSQMMAGMQQRGVGFPPEAASKIKRAITEALPYTELVEWTVEIYATRFNAEEIKQLLAFFKTPAGRKSARLIPEISGEVGKKMVPIMMQRLPEAMRRNGLTPPTGN